MYYTQKDSIIGVWIAKENEMTRTNIDINDRLIKEGMSITHCKTKKELVNYALEELVKIKHRKGILKFAGTKCWKGNLDKMRTM